MFVAIATAALSASAVYSQTLPSIPTADNITMSGLQSLSTECRTAILSLALSPLTQCLGINELAPAISANASLVPILDNWMTSICANEACDQDLLDSTAQNFSSACNSDLAKYDISGTDIQDIVGMYPLVRELVCLKTAEPFVSNSTMNMTMPMDNVTMPMDNSTMPIPTDMNSTMPMPTTMDNATIPMGMSNSTDNSTFCVTSLLDEVTSYLGMNITVNGIFNLVFGKDTEGRKALAQIPPSALCQDCIYAGAGLIEQQYPGIWNETIGSGNFTVGGFLNETCVNSTFPEIDREMNPTITLPEAVYPSAENSTYAYPIMYMNATSMMNETYTPGSDVKQAPSIPFLNFPPQDVEGGEPASTANTSAIGPQATSSSTATSSGVAASASSAMASVTAPVVSAASSAASVAAPAQATKRDVTAAKRRWVGQQ